MKKDFLKKLRLKNTRKPSKLNQLVIGLVVLGSLAVIIFIVNVICLNWPQPSVATLLPAKTTVMMAEINDFNLPIKLKTEEEDMKMVQIFGQPFGLELMPALKSFANNGMAYAMVKESDSKDDPLLFIKAQSKGKVLDYFKTLLLPNETLSQSKDKNPIYSFPQGQSFVFRFDKGYVIIAQNQETLKLLDGTKANMLNADENYRKSTDNLPHHPWMLGYADIQNIKFSQNLTASGILEPLKYAIHNAAFTVEKDQEGFKFNTFVNLNKDLLSLSHGKSEKKFAYALTDNILDDGVGMYMGGADLESEWLNTLDTISNLNPAYGIIMEGILRAQANDIFGAQVDLRNDLYPLFQGEYAVSVGTDKVGKTVSLILSHDDREFAEKKMEKLSQGFKFLAGKFAPKVAVVTLPDGTESRELVPDDGKMETTQETVKGYTVNCTEISGTDIGFCYTVTDKIIMITNSKNRLMNTINSPDAPMLSGNASFRKTLANLSKVNDEVTYMDFDQFSKLLGGNPYVQALQPILSKLKAGSWVKHYFADGVSAEGYVVFK